MDGWVGSFGFTSSFRGGVVHELASEDEVG